MTSFIDLQHDGHLTTLTVNRPDKLNSLDTVVLTQLRGAIDEVAGRAETRAMIVTGAGKAFVAGADIAAMLDMNQEQARAFGQLGHDTFSALDALRCPVIAAVNGFALGGGCELALACDFIYASEKARFGLPEVGLGILPGFGGTQRLPRRVGPGHARELAYTGRMIGADEALRIGLANAVFAADELLPAATKTATEIASKGPLAVGAAKRAISDGLDVTLAEGNAIEVQTFGKCFESADRREGMEAFLAKREASFEGR